MIINTILVSSHEYSLNDAKKILQQLDQVYLTYESKSASAAIEEIRKGQTKLVIIVDKPKDDLLSNFILRIMETKPTPCLILMSNPDNNTSYREYIDIPLVDTIDYNRDDAFFAKLLSIRINIMSKLKVEKFTNQLERVGKSLREKSRREKDYQEKEVSPISDTPQDVEIVEVVSNRRREIKKPDGNDDDTDRRIDFTRVVVIGASTGGPRALTEVLTGLPREFPPVLVVQHMPRGFVPSFADRLNYFCKMQVKVAEDGEIVRKNTVYVAPGGRHMELDKIGASVVKIKITEGPLVNFVRPAVDVTLFSAARVWGNRVVSVICTGMGNDGREGSRVVKKMGGNVIAQAEEGSVVYGMNKAVIESNIADTVAELPNVARAIVRTVTLIPKKVLEEAS